VTVRASLEGHEFDLQMLAELFPEGDPRVVKDSEGVYHLESSDLEKYFGDGGRILDAAEQILGPLLAAARLEHADFQDVSLASRFDRPKADGTTERSSHVTDSATARERVTVVRLAPIVARSHAYAVAVVTYPDGATVEPAKPRGLRYLSLMRAHPEVAELLQLLSTSDMSWDDLYKTYEIVNDATGRGKKTHWALESLGYDRTEVSNFKGTVNLRRHARPTGHPQRELTLADCQHFVRDMAERWFQQLESGVE
jgi:hypothetical protein